jgi:hypothetical protein
MKLDILDWLSSGDFMGVNVGISKNEVVSILGQPEGWADTRTTDRIVDFLDADMWGYGIWVFYFNGDKLDAVTGFIGGLDQDSSYCFEVGGFIPSIETEYQDVVDELVTRNCKYYDLPKYFMLKNRETGEMLENKRRLGYRILLVGSKFLGRITFDKSSNKIWQVAYPYGVATQLVGYDALGRKKEWSLVEK